MKSKIHLIGYAHLDPVWLWRWQEGYAEIKATFRSALERMNEFPDFIFTYPCASYYEWVEENAPDMFSEIVARVREGRWRIVGGMWNQPDCNIPSGESFARHFLLGQRYFREKFGITAVTGYNVDSFGHNASMPKLLKAAGINNYVMMRPDKTENPNIPELAFWWESNDGSRVLVYKIANGYVSYIHGDDSFKNEYEEDKAASCLEIADNTDLPTMYFYGVGNHGGGPTIKSLNTLEKLRKAPDGERFVYSSPDTYFNELCDTSKLPVWKGDMQHHASLCYSACSEIKRNNRRAENRLTSAEAYSVLSGALAGYILPDKILDKAWKNVLFNQFHDIAAGCSIPSAYEDAREFHGEALSIAAQVQNAAVQRLSWAVDTSKDGRGFCDKTADWQYWGSEDLGTPIIVFNPLSWTRKISTRVSRPARKITDENGVEVPTQKTKAERTDNTTGNTDFLFQADVPAMGWRLYWAYPGDNKESKVYPESEKPVSGDNSFIENDFLLLEINNDGYISNLFDKLNNHEIFSENAAVPLIIDVEHADTWGHGIFSFRNVIGRFCNAIVTIVESGPVRSVVSVESFYNTSILRQDFILFSDSKQVEVNVKLDWREKFKLLKLSFPVNNKDKIKTTYGIPFGSAKRPPNGMEEPGQLWLDVSDEEYGIALLNDGKYAFDVLENDMRMTVANGSMYAEHYAEKLRSRRSEHLDQGIQFFTYALLPHTNNQQNDQLYSRITKAAIELNTETVHIAETYHKGTLPGTYKGIEVTADNIIITAVKPAFDGEGTIIRAYEAAGVDTDCEIRLFCLDAIIKATFPKNTVKSFRVNGNEIKECNFIED
jgi:alpha-mannosidase